LSGGTTLYCKCIRSIKFVDNTIYCIKLKIYYILIQIIVSVEQINFGRSKIGFSEEGAQQWCCVRVAFFLCLCWLEMALYTKDRIYQESQNFVICDQLGKPFCVFVTRSAMFFVNRKHKKRYGTAPLFTKIVVIFLKTPYSGHQCDKRCANVKCHDCS